MLAPSTIARTDWNGNRRILQKGASDNQYRLLAENGVLKFDDLPIAYRGNLDTLPPFDRHIGDPPALSEAPSPRRPQLYRWIDEQGVVHLTDNPESVPPQLPMTLAAYPE